MMSGRSSGIARWLAVVALVALSSGCFKAQQDLTVKGDGSGRYQLHLEVNEKAIAAVAGSFSGFGGDSSTTIGSTSTTAFFPLGDQSLPGGVEIKANRVGDKVIADVSFPFTDVADFERKMRQVDAAMSRDGRSSDAPTGGALTITRRGDVVDISLTETDSPSAKSDGFDPDAFADVLKDELKPSFIVRITGPGGVVRTNADSVEGRTGHWDMLRAGSPSTLTMTSKVEPELPYLLPLIGAGLLLLLVGAAVLVVARTRVRATSVEGDPSVIATTTPPPPAAPPGWYDNPDGAGEKYWNGAAWTSEERAATVPWPAPQRPPEDGPAR